jgi:hypothetical protein
VQAWFAARFGGEPLPPNVPAPEMRPDQDTSIADYVWLPVRFDGDMAYLDWKDEWRIEEYE